jgi:glycosyltransferase involved in cell wall biosynthesis
MSVPVLSVVVPALNEERCIEDFLLRVSRFLESRGPFWEIVVVDDGSDDRTVALVEQWSAADPRVRLLRQPHRGKGSAIRHGMLAAHGAWRFMADADLSVSPDDWFVFMDAAREPDAAEVIIGSREAAGSRRVGEPIARHLIGRTFNWLVQLLMLPGINDTQCGFKMLSADAARVLFPLVTIDGFAFDVELLFLARRAGFRIREVGVLWTCRRDSRVRFGRGAAAFADVGRIRLRQLRGRYRHVGRRRPATASEDTRAAS